MLKSIGALVGVRLREVVLFWEGPLREAPLYMPNKNRWGEIGRTIFMRAF
jgi:hypothetical protein